MTQTVTKRNSAMEILRIIAMFLIIFSHYVNHGTSLTPDDSFNGTLFSLFYSGNIGTVIFVLISGYFLVNSKINLKKVFVLISQVVFYSVSIYLLCIALSAEHFSLKNALSAFFPTSFSLYWFFTTYIVMYILSPFINKFLNSISKATHRNLILATVILWIVLPTLTFRNFAGNEFTLFFTLYATGAYMRKYPQNIITAKRRDIIIIVATILILAGSAISVILLFPSYAKYSTLLYSRNSVVVFALSVALISFFSKLKPFYSGALNTVAGTCFGIYLIHDNKFFKDFMWREIFKTSEFENSNYMILHMFGCTIIIFTAGFVIEFVRKKIIEKPLLILFDKAYSKLEPKLVAFKNKQH